MRILKIVYFSTVIIMLFICLAVGRYDFMRHLPDFLWPKNPLYWYGQLQFVHLNLILLTFVGLLAVGPHFNVFHMRTQREKESNVFLLMFILGWYAIFIVTFPVVAHCCGR